jgi:DNA processing protein
MHGSIAYPRPDSGPEADLEALLHLIAAGGPAAPRRQLLETHGPAAALRAGQPAWREAGLDARQIAALRSGGEPAALDHARRWLAQPGRALLGWHDPDYPPLLRRISSPPLALFLDGDPALAWRPSVAVVGSRAPTEGGREHAFAFATQLARAGFVIASGLASGIDAAAHRAALALGPGRTVAVLGCGPDVAYPSTHRGLLAEVAAQGCVISEHPPGTQPRREFFPSRNRLLAGLSLGTLVIEAGQRSGALITARQAADAGREVFALPGSIRNPLSRGCHRLIRDGAQLVEDPQEVIDQLASLAAAQAADLRAQLNAPIHPAVARHPQAEPEPDPHYKRLWQVLGHDPTPMDALVERSGLTAAELSSMLLVMELEGRVSVEHGRYSRK